MIIGSYQAKLYPSVTSDVVVRSLTVTPQVAAPRGGLEIKLLTPVEGTPSCKSATRRAICRGSRGRELMHVTRVTRLVPPVTPAEAVKIEKPKTKCVILDGGRA